MSDEAKLKDGAEWVDHEDCLIADKQGLENLKKACEVALEKGEYFGNDLGDYVGVKKLESSWFKDLQDSKSTKLANGFLVIGLILIVMLVLVGGYTLFSWIL